MNYIDEDMWKKQEQINTILDYLCGSDEEVAEANKNFNKLNWFQKKIEIIGDSMNDFWLLGYLDRIEKIEENGTVHYKNKFSSVWGEVRHMLVNRASEKNINDKTWHFFFIFYIKWIFICIWKWISFQWLFYNIKKNVKPSI